MTDRILESAKIGPYTFEKVDHEFGGKRTIHWRFRIDGQRPSSEVYSDLDHALASAIAERHMGARGAGGTAVGTAADWFMRMIRQDHVDNAAKAKDVVRRLMLADSQWLRHVEKCEKEGVTDRATINAPGERILDERNRLRAELDDLLRELS